MIEIFIEKLLHIFFFFIIFLQFFIFFLVNRFEQIQEKTNTIYRHDQPVKSARLLSNSLRCCICETNKIRFYIKVLLYAMLYVVYTQ